MRFAIISDLHANLEATQTVIADAHDNDCTQFVCLGDLVGYNANPHECVELVRALDCPSVKGNHDEQASLEESTRDFNELAEQAINWTRENLTKDDKEWLAALRMTRPVHDFTIVHATLDTPHEWGYVFDNLKAAASFTYQHTTICFFGHTHVAGAFVRDEGVRKVKTDRLMIETGKKYFINTGSVGQPRDGDPRAAYCIYDTDKSVVEQRRLKYDLPTTQRKIIEAGLPRLLAERLEHGR
ncbi:MAG: metallophosphoesterase family protein [Chthoniobacterales bacterium]|nr:metallophosphoesterase family protein [Chthoniobacterales bacterium]